MHAWHRKCCMCDKEKGVIRSPRGGKYASIGPSSICPGAGHTHTCGAGCHLGSCDPDELALDSYFFHIRAGYSLINDVHAQLLLRPKAPNPVKFTAYEFRHAPIGEAQARYTIRYYVIAMLFVVFDIEAVFFYPWAVAFNSLGWYGLIEMVLFIVLLLVAYVYAWRKGALDWVSS